MSVQRRPFTLIEALLSLGLTAVLMTLLSYFYLQFSQIDSLEERAVRNLYQLSYVENRLATVLPRAVAENTAKKDFLFFTCMDSGGGLFKEGTMSLIFAYDNGICLDKLFSNHVLGRLFVDRQGNLVLATWPSPVRWKEGRLPPVKKEYLLDNVEGLKLSFYVAPEVDRSKVAKVSPKTKERQQFSPQPPGSWITAWSANYYQLPPIVRIDLKLRSQPGGGPQEVHFAFPLPNSTSVIFY